MVYVSMSRRARFAYHSVQTHRPLYSFISAWDARCILTVAQQSVQCFHRDRQTDTYSNQVSHRNPQIWVWIVFVINFKFDYGLRIDAQTKTVNILPRWIHGMRIWMWFEQNPFFAIHSHKFEMRNERNAGVGRRNRDWLLKRSVL